MPPALTRLAVSRLIDPHKETGETGARSGRDVNVNALRYAGLTVCVLSAACSSPFAPSSDPGLPSESAPASDESATGTETPRVRPNEPAAAATKAAVETPSSKPSLPVNVVVRVAPKYGSIGDLFTVHLGVSPHRPNSKLLARFEADDKAIELSGEKVRVFEDVVPETTYETSIGVRLLRPGRAELRGHGISPGGNGRMEMSASKPVYFVASDKWVYCGVVGYMPLELALLAKRLEEGEISADAYPDLKRKIEYGGAKERITVTPPS